LATMKEIRRKASKIARGRRDHNIRGKAYPEWTFGLGVVGYGPSSRNDRATDLLENGFKRYFWKSLFGTSLDRLAIEAPLSSTPTHLHDSVCGVAMAKSTGRRSVKSKVARTRSPGVAAPASAVSASEAN
ncbi:MAG: hypothetical protein WBE50_14040, partial [Methyloceanibacter sp.]